MLQYKNRKGFAFMLAISLIAILSIASVGTVAASNSAKPGDFLYPIDTGVENLRLSLPLSPASEVDLRAQLAAERLAEIQALLQDQNPNVSGVNIALANLTDQKTQIAALLAQNQELQARVSALENQLNQEGQSLNPVFQQTEKNLNSSLEEANSSGDSEKASQIKVKLDDLESQKKELSSEKEDKTESEVENESENEVENENENENENESENKGDNSSQESESEGE